METGGRRTLDEKSWFAPMIVPDANILIAYFSTKSKTRPVFDELVISKKIIFSIVAVAEFLVGATEEEAKILAEMMKKNKLIPLDKNIMEQAVSYRKKTLQKTKRAHLLDCFIAATAKFYNATLVTLDSSDYPFSDLTVKQPEELRFS